MTRIKILIVSMVITAMLLMTVSIPRVQASAIPPVLPPNARVQGLTLGQWMAKDWRATFEIPASQNPFLGNPWPNCFLKRIGNVGLGVIYGISGTFVCTMPAGMMLYIIANGLECSTAEQPPYYGANEKELRACALNKPMVNTQASIDGIPVKDIDKYTALSPFYHFDLPADNFLGNVAGTYKSVAYGIAFILTPLNPGKHTVHVHGELPSVSFVYDVIYQITVTK
jgi:hypothetical protein